MECKKHSDWLGIQPMRHSESAALRIVELGKISQFGQNMAKAIML